MVVQTSLDITVTLDGKEKPVYKNCTSAKKTDNSYSYKRKPLSLIPNNMINIESSIIGFHNPRKHQGLTADEFLLTYLKRQATLSIKREKMKEVRAAIVVMVLADYDRWLLRVKKLFPRTFKNELQ